jgi:hypothetical protein
MAQAFGVAFRDRRDQSNDTIIQTIQFNSGKEKGVFLPPQLPQKGEGGKKKLLSSFFFSQKPKNFPKKGFFFFFFTLLTGVQDW